MAFPGEKSFLAKTHPVVQNDKRAIRLRSINLCAATLMFDSKTDFENYFRNFLTSVELE